MVLASMKRFSPSCLFLIGRHLSCVKHPKQERFPKEKPLSHHMLQPSPREGAGKVNWQEVGVAILCQFKVKPTGPPEEE